MGSACFAVTIESGSNTRPDLLARWFGPKDFTTCEVEADGRVGGRFAFRMTGPCGVYGAEGIYREVVPPRRLVLTWTWTEGPEGEEPDGVTLLVTFEFQGDGDATLLTLIHAGLPDQEQADSRREGWNEALEKLARTLI